MAESSKRGSKYSIAEDVALCKAYIAITEDGEVGANQTKQTFWDRVFTKFVGLYPNREGRKPHRIGNCFGVISKEVSKYVGLLAYYHRNKQSGWSELDIIRNTQSEYMHKEKKPFAFEECYQVLQALPKFNYLMILGTGPMNEEGYDSNPVTPTGSFQHFETPGEFCPNAQTDTNSSEHQIPEPLQRPPGQKATKRAKRSGASSSSSSLESIIDETSNRIVNIFRENQEKRQHQRDSQNERLDMAMQLKREELAMKRREEEDRIMSVNTQNMPPDLRFYWQQRQQEIISQRGIPPGNRF